MEHNNTSYNPSEIAWIYGFRGKVWQPIQWRILCLAKHGWQFRNSLYNNLEFENTEELVMKNIDPSLVLTYSKKFWNNNISNLIIQHYTNPKMFHIQTEYGYVSTRLGFLQSKPLWAHHISQSVAYQHQLQCMKFYPFLKAIFGVKSIHVVGSHALGLAHSNSDVDIIVLTYSGMALLVRFWLKIILKLHGFDIHSLRFEILSRFGYFIRNTSLQQYAHKQQELFHTREGLKIDAGIITDNITLVENRFPRLSRNAWLWQGKDIGQQWNATAMPHSFLNRLLFCVYTVFITITSPLLYIFAVGFQLMWLRFFTSKSSLQSDSLVNFHICSFFTPDFPFSQKVQLDG